MNKGTLLVDTLKCFKTEDIVCRVQGSEHNNYKSTLNLHPQFLNVPIQHALI